MNPLDYQTIRQLLDEYLRMYSTRDYQLTTHFSEDFSGFTGSGDFLVKNREEWIAITRQDFAQVKDPIRLELKDFAIQSLADTIAVATSFFTIHLPIKDHILSRETARLVLIFNKESTGWKISHSSISIPYAPAREGEVYPMAELASRNQVLEKVIAERTVQLSEANDHLRQANEKLAKEIAEHKHAAEALQRSEERYRSILNASPDDITITDPQGRILMLSPMAFNIFGYERDHPFQGLSILDFIVPEDRERALAQIALKRQGVITGTSEYRGLRRDGSTFDIEVNSEFIRDAQGSPTGMVLIARDISERKRAEAEKEKLEAQNRQLQKSESLGRMAGAIAHHFNNQLHAVTLSLELAKADSHQSVGLIERLDEAMQSVRKAAEVSSLMLTYLGHGPSQQEPLDVSQTCQELLPMLRASVPSSRPIQAQLPSPGPTVRANANQIQQVLINLITNAWEADGDGTSAIRLAVKTVGAADIPVKHRFPIDWQPQENAYACLEVADMGCGIPENDIERIFDPFFSTKFTGRGLGLAVVYGIVRTHRGAISVESQPGRGSVFRLFLPLSTEAVPAKKSVPVDTAPRPPESGSVLLVEDEPAVRTAMTHVLRQLGFSVHAAIDGVEAVEVFRQRQGQIRCVLCDLTMPRKDGWETLEALRQLAPGIPVILASGYSETQVLTGDHPELPQVFLRKPFTVEELRTALAQALEIGNQ